MSEIVKISDLVKYYYVGENVVKAVDHTNLEIERGKFTAIVGRSGSGKSTLLQIIGGLDRPDSGKVIIDGKNLYELKGNQLAVFRRKKIGFIFQDFNLIPSLNVWENVVLTMGLDGRKVNKGDILYEIDSPVILYQIYCFIKNSCSVAIYLLSPSLK